MDSLSRASFTSLPGYTIDEAKNNKVIVSSKITIDDKTFVVKLSLDKTKDAKFLSNSHELERKMLETQEKMSHLAIAFQLGEPKKSNIFEIGR